MQKFVVKKSKSASSTQDAVTTQVKMSGYLKKKRNVSVTSIIERM